MRPTPTSRALAASLGVVGAACTLAGAGCGGADDPPEAPGPGTDAGPVAEEGAEAPHRGARGAEAPGAEVPRARGRADAPAGDRANGGVGCVFEPPAGRLAVDRMPVELDGTTCPEALRLVEAVAVGQPAGANLELTRDGFRCTPSTLEKGGNVTYMCASGAREAMFDVVWSRAEP